MTKKQLRGICSKVVLRLKKIDCKCWVSRVKDFPIVHQFNKKGCGLFDIEIDLLENEDSYLHVIVRVSDEGFIHSMFPVCESFIVNRTC